MQASFGKVVEVRIVTTAAGASKGFGYVQFAEEHAALEATKSSLQLGTRRLKIDIANRKRAPPLEGPSSSSSAASPELDIAHNPTLRTERITAFLGETSRFENAIAYRFLDSLNWDVAAAVASYKAGDPIPDVRVREAPEEKPAPEEPQAGPAVEPPERDPAPEPDVESEDADDNQDQEGARKSKKAHVFVHIHILQEYLQHEFEVAFQPTKTHFEIERVIDDFVLICMMCGNDFLPHIPMLDIRKGAIDGPLFCPLFLLPPLTLVVFSLAICVQACVPKSGRISCGTWPHQL